MWFHVNPGAAFYRRQTRKAKVSHFLGVSVVLPDRDCRDSCAVSLEKSWRVMTAISDRRYSPVSDAAGFELLSPAVTEALDPEKCRGSTWNTIGFLVAARQMWRLAREIRGST